MVNTRNTSGTPSKTPSKKLEDPASTKKSTTDPKQNAMQVDGEPAEKKPATATGKDDKQEPELSEEDQQLKSELELLVERLKESDTSLYRPALESLRVHIRTSTTSMTSVPKPLKFLRPHYSTLAALYEAPAWQKSAENKRFLADVLSVLGMTFYEEGKRDSLKYRLLGSAEALASWGHEYVRHLAGEIMQEYAARLEADQSVEDLMKLAMEIVPFFLQHNAEADACDLMIELESLDKLPALLDKNTFSRVAMYLTSCANYVASPDDLKAFRVVHKIYRDNDKWTEAMSIAMKLNDKDLIKEDFTICPDALTKKQMAYMLARQLVSVEVADEELTSILANAHLSEQFLGLARELDVMEPKTPEDIYKSHLENTRPGLISASVDSARQNLASTFVNAFVNVGFGTDKLMTSGEEGSSWIYKNKDHGMACAAASMGAIMLWDVEMGLTQIDKFLYSSDNNIKAGALMAIGIVNSGVRNESDPALALLSEHIEDKNTQIRVAAIFGLGIAYAGTGREDVLELLMPIINDTTLTMELSGFAALSAGLIFVGTSNGDITSTILQTMMERDETALKDSYGKYLILGLALLFLGRQDEADATLETLKAIEGPLAKQALVLVDGCAYVATGNVLKIQTMLHHCNDHLDKEKENDTFQSIAVICIGLIAMGEEIGSQMALRVLNQLMHYGEPSIRRLVPIAIGLLCASNPIVTVLDTLSKYSHDNDHEVAVNAIFAIGLVGAGTNNARLAQMLRQLASYYHKDPNSLFMVRIAQGLVHMGKGTVSINPFHSNRFLMSPVATAGLLATVLSFTDTANLVLGKSSFILYYLICAIYPRFLITLDENLKNLAVTVRVGQAVDTVGQAGRPKTITGFQTHSTPVLLAYSERAELASEEYLSSTHVLEGFAILKKNPEWQDEVAEK